MIERLGSSHQTVLLLVNPFSYNIHSKHIGISAVAGAWSSDQHVLVKILSTLTQFHVYNLLKCTYVAVVQQELHN